MGSSITSRSLFFSVFFFWLLQRPKVDQLPNNKSAYQSCPKCTHKLFNALPLTKRHIDRDWAVPQNIRPTRFEILSNEHIEFALIRNSTKSLRNWSQSLQKTDVLWICSLVWSWSGGPLNVMCCLDLIAARFTLTYRGKGPWSSSMSRAIASAAQSAHYAVNVNCVFTTSRAFNLKKDVLPSHHQSYLIYE